jgi:citrate lyase beta subunit
MHASRPLVDLDLVTCLLFAPASRPDRFEKVVQSGADGIIIDLEDAIPLAGKDPARATTIEFFAGQGRARSTSFLRAIRVNGLSTKAGLEDLLAIRESRIVPDAIVLPKVESPHDVNLYARHLAGAQESIRLIALVETAIGLEHAVEIARSSPRIAGLAFGGADLAADLGASFAWEPLLAARSRLVQAAATAGIAALDVPYLDVRDDGALRSECERARALGFTGKLAIHPRHVPVILDAFLPDPDALERARRIVDTFAASAGGACEIDGKMIDPPVYRSAQRVVALAARRRPGVAT